MLKRILVTLSFVCMAGPLLFGQAADEIPRKEEKQKLNFDMGITIGLTSYEDIDGVQEGYQKLGFYPQFSRGQWRFGFDFTLEFDGKFNLRDLDKDGKSDTWTTFSDWLYKVQYVEYAHKGDSIYGRIGEFDSYYMGYGMLMKDFNNNLFYPYILQRGLLFDFDADAVDFPYLGVESIVNDVLDWDVLGARLFVRPLAVMSAPLISQLELGGAVVADLDPQQEYTSQDTRPPKDNPASDTVTTFGIDVGLPIIQSEDMDLVTYVDWGIIVSRGNGISAGADFRYTWIRLLVELRYLGKEFVPHYFDPFYWVERPNKYDSLNLLTDDYFGYLVGADLNLWNLFTLYFNWEDGLADVVDPRIMTGLVLSEDAWKKIGFHITYDKKGIGSFKDFADLDNSLFEALFEYRVTDFASIVFIQDQSFASSGASTSQTYIETRFLF
jgi:hypothetical protein